MGVIGVTDLTEEESQFLEGKDKLIRTPEGRVSMTPSAYQVSVDDESLLSPSALDQDNDNFVENSQSFDDTHSQFTAKLPQT